jgi:hypothetical protein
VALSVSVLGSSTQAADPSADLAEAETQVASAEAEIAFREAQVATARSRYAAASRRAEAPAGAAQAARSELRELRTSLRLRQRQAEKQIADLEAAHNQAVDEHDEEVATDAGFGMAALIAAGIALAWGRFRDSAAVAALTRIDLGRVLGLCLGGGLLVLVIGAVLADATGFARALGAFLFGLGIVLPTALLLARHSVEVQRGQAKPLLKRERLPAWVTRVSGLLLLLLAISGLGSAFLAEEPSAKPIPARLQEDAEPLTSGPAAQELAEARAKAAAAQRAATDPLARQQDARAALRTATRALRRAEARLVDAEADERRSARRLAALVASEEREAARETARAEKVAEEETEEAEESEEAVPSGCDPNYSGCVPPYPPDADCDEVGETVTVLGEDPHGLDADGDLAACE